MFDHKALFNHLRFNSPVGQAVWSVAAAPRAIPAGHRYVAGIVVCGVEEHERGESPVSTMEVIGKLRVISRMILPG